MASCKKSNNYSTISDENSSHTLEVLNFMQCICCLTQVPKVFTSFHIAEHALCTESGLLLELSLL